MKKAKALLTRQRSRPSGLGPPPRPLALPAAAAPRHAASQPSIWAWMGEGNMGESKDARVLHQEQPWRAPRPCAAHPTPGHTLTRHTSHLVTPSRVTRHTCWAMAGAAAASVVAAATRSSSGCAKRSFHLISSELAHLHEYGDAVAPYQSTSTVH
jgi:hypothetical protein